MRKLRRNKQINDNKKFQSLANKLMTGLVAGTMMLSPFADVLNVHAQENTPVVFDLPANYATPGGVATLGNGPASIKILNDKDNFVGKKFAIYKLFDEENSVDGESVNYKWNKKYKTALQTVVGKKLNKEANKVTEYEVIDYMQSLDDEPDKTPEGALPGSGNQDVRPQPDSVPQQLEGRYSAFRYFVEELRDELKTQNLAPEVVEVTELDAYGNITFAGLDYGYYLTDELYTSADKHSSASLIMTNTANPDAEVEIKSDYPEVQKKIFEDDDPNSFNNTHSGPTEEELGTWSTFWDLEELNLLKTVNRNKTGWQDINDVEIGQKVNYEYLTAVPDINGYSEYYFAFHDKMDKALTFHKDSVVIEISGFNGSEEKSYILDPSDFVISENVGEDTFLIEINDLKAIVDREFNKGFDEYKHNEYGQDIRVRYDATLNEEARLDTGRPGFENDVYLEFSNNPDSNGQGQTGKTPIDTVVTYTYQINGLKVNEHDKSLANAEFRLYTDKECKNEVFTKKMAEGNVVINRDSLGGSDHMGGSAPAEATVIKSDKDGKFNIIGLDQGTYYLKEVKAPAGYRLMLYPIELNLKPTFTTERNAYVKGEGATEETLQKFEVTSHVNSFFDGVFHPEETQLETNVENGSAQITVVNKTGKVMPITGSSMTLVCLLGGVALVTVGKKMTSKE